MAKEGGEKGEPKNDFLLEKCDVIVLKQEDTHKMIECKNTEASIPQHYSLSRLGELGLVKGDNGKYKLYDNKGNQIKQCAKTRNEIEKVLGHPTTNNAWDTFGFYGDSTLYNGYPAKIGPYTKLGFFLANQIAANRMQRNIDNINLQTGDVVSLYNPFSHYSKEAWNTGTLNRSNTHTGVIYQPYPGVRGKTYVIHNVNGSISVDPIGNFFITSDNLLPKWRATGVFRPGTKDHPYVRNGKPAHL